MALLHAPTGSGKMIAYLLPITETLWKEIENDGGNDMANGMALILLPRAGWAGCRGSICFGPSWYGASCSTSNGFDE
jgi:hypothetical protein